MNFATERTPSIFHLRAFILLRDKSPNLPIKKNKRFAQKKHLLKVLINICVCYAQYVRKNCLFPIELFGSSAKYLLKQITAIFCWICTDFTFSVFYFNEQTIQRFLRHIARKVIGFQFVRNQWNAVIC